MTDFINSETLTAFGGNEQRAKVFLDRYAKKDGEGNPVELTPDAMWRRVALALSGTIEGALIDSPDAKDYNDFLGILKDFKFVPGGRILAGAGIDSEVTFYNCYVIPVETRARREGRAVSPLGFDHARDTGNDSREAIFDTIGLMVDIMSRGGGVGINWSVLRPSGAYLQRVNGTSSGPVGWMDVASKAVGEVEQGGSRRGAAMFMLDDWHPDVLKFIDAKRDFGRITNANVSVAVSDTFMEAVADDRYWYFGFPDTTDPHYDTEWDGDANAWLDKGYGWKEYGDIKARDLWRKLAEAAHASGEPGVVFLDRYNKVSTGAGVERLISVNPCGEQGLGAYSVCNLGAMNLDAYIVEAEEVKGGPFNRVDVNFADTPTGRSFDYESFAKDVKTAVRFLDRAIDVNYYFLPENEKVQKDLRRIGLSVMGLADALIALGYRYGSPEAVEFTEAVFRTMKESAVDESANLAAKYGPCPAWQETMYSRPYLRDLPLWLLDKVTETNGLRNMFLLTQAPTGTTSILAGVNSGIEPYFAFEYTRKDRTGEHRVVAPALAKYFPNGVPYRGGELVTSNDVTVEEHIAMQAAVQKYVDSSVSKTINGPNSHTVEDVEKAYTLAYESGLKGLAYFRDGSGRDQVLYKDEPVKGSDFQHIDWCVSQGAFGAEDCDCPETPRELRMMKRIDDLIAERDGLQERVAIQAADLTEFRRPDVLKGETRKVRTSMGTAYVTVNRDENDVAREVFFSVGKAGSDIAALAEALGRLGSLALRKGASLGGVANQLEGVGGSGNFNVPLASALGKALTDMNVSRALTEEGQRPLPKLTDLLSRIPVFKSPVPQGALFVSDMDALKADVRKTLYPEEFFPAEEPATRRSTADLCPECGSVSLIREEGCSKCHVCGYSAC